MAGRVLAVLAASTGLLLSLGLGGLRQGAAQGPDRKGPELCASCHRETVEAYLRTPHAAGAKGCEACHGDASAHAAAGGDAGLIRSLKGRPASEASAACLACHVKGTTRHWTGSAHDQRQMGCTSCHAPHAGPAPRPALLRKGQLELCTACHLQNKAKLMRSGHMPLREGKLRCSSCHNAHGTPHEAQLLQASVNQNCTSCHAEKRGPFLWEHAPVRENCLNCHDAHGSIQDKLLKVKQPLLCQQCHQAASHPGVLRTSRDRYAFNRACLSCHPSIHGSTHPSGNRFFR